MKSCLKVENRGCFLDIGCGMGRNLEIASEYYDECLGLELSPRSVQVTRDKGFEVIHADIDHARISPGRVDMILMDSVIEHVPSPTSTLSRINSFLRMGGGIAMKPPKFGGPTYRRRGPEWNGFRHGYHTFLYSGRTLANLMHKCGFEVCRSPRRDRILDDILILYGRKIRNVDVVDHINGYSGIVA